MAEAESATERSVETDTEPDDGGMTFTFAGVREGFITGFPVAVGVAGYGVVFGVIADQAGLSVAEAALMSATVLAGAAQLIGVELWADSVPMATVVATVGIVNLRYLLMGAALRPWFRQLAAGGLRQRLLHRRRELGTHDRQAPLWQQSGRVPAR